MVMTEYRIAVMLSLGDPLQNKYIYNKFDSLKIMAARNVVYFPQLKRRISDTLIGYLPIFSDASQNFPMHKISLVSF